uniref:Uncharacterized protein n=1 Tax=Geobacter sp. (strain M21) TaxID=443144 RepID=C6DZZ8_GEOSM
MRHSMKAGPIRVEADALREDRRFYDAGQQHFGETGGFGMKLAGRIVGRVFRGLDQSTERLREIRDSYRQLNFEMHRRQLRSFRNQC